MCNHYRASGEWRTRMDEFSRTKIPLTFDWAAPRANVQGDDVFPAYVGEILRPQDGALVSASATWLYMPPTEKGPFAAWRRKFGGANNARGEKADTGWPWKFAARSGRCLIPGEAFFEWDDGPKGGKSEYRFAYPDGRAFFFAGLCGRAEPEEGPLLTYTMLTKAAGGDTASIGHGRQPMVLQPDEIAAFLDPANPIAAFAERLDPAGTFSLTPVKGPKSAA